MIETKLQFVGNKVGSSVSTYKVSYLSLGIGVEKDLDVNCYDLLRSTEHSLKFGFRISSMLKAIYPQSDSVYRCRATNSGIIFVRNENKKEPGNKPELDVFGYLNKLKMVWLKNESEWFGVVRDSDIPKISTIPAIVNNKSNKNIKNIKTPVEMKLSLTLSQNKDVSIKEKLLIVVNHAYKCANSSLNESENSSVKLDSHQREDLVNLFLDENSILPLKKRSSNGDTIYTNRAILLNKRYSSKESSDDVSNFIGSLDSGNFRKEFFIGLMAIDDLKLNEMLSICNVLSNLTIFGVIGWDKDFLSIYKNFLKEKQELPVNFKKLLACMNIMNMSGIVKSQSNLTLLCGGVIDLIDIKKQYVKIVTDIVNKTNHNDVNQIVSTVPAYLNDIDDVSWDKPLYLLTTTQLNFVQDIANGIIMFSKPDELAKVVDSFNECFGVNRFISMDYLKQGEQYKYDVLHIDLEAASDAIGCFKEENFPNLFFNKARDIVQNGLNEISSLHWGHEKPENSINFMLSEKFNNSDTDLSGVYQMSRHMYFYFGKSDYSSELAVKAVDEVLPQLLGDLYYIESQMSNMNEEKRRALSELSSKFIVSLKKSFLKAYLNSEKCNHVDDEASESELSNQGITTQFKI